jgi:hypothetical protein
MKNFIALTTIVLSACSTTPSTGEQPTTVSPAQEQPNPVPNIKPANDGLSDLGAMTFSCPQAGLNAAAREAAKVPSQGHYQFAYFSIINDAHHSLYEVHFKSNYQSEADLKYCVSVYCQQGQDQAPSVSLITNAAEPSATSAKGSAHSATCGGQPNLTKRIEPKRLLKKR